MGIPNDPVILMSYLNTQLRDNYSSLEDLCKTMDLQHDKIIEKLSSVGYQYDSVRNQFISISCI